MVEHEATTSKISDDQLFSCNQRGLDTEEAVGLIVNGYAREVLNKLPMEFAVEAQKLLSVSLEGSVDQFAEPCNGKDRCGVMVREAGRYPLHLTEPS